MNSAARILYSRKIIHQILSVSAICGHYNNADSILKEYQTELREYIEICGGRVKAPEA
jgi:hypothetical protein